MYALALWLRPTAALTFRILPGSILDIATYPFVPPTTLSGWLRRLWILAETGEVAGLREGNEPKFYVLPRRYIPLGAYPLGGSQLHRTYRHGPRSFNHDQFSRIVRRGKTPKGGDLQLHTWEYLLTGCLLGALLAERSEDLEPLHKLVGYGFKLGKEGWAYLEKVAGPVLIQRETVEGTPFAPLPLELWLGEVEAVYPLYRFVWEDQSDPDPPMLEPSPISGYEGSYMVLPTGKGKFEGFTLAEKAWPWPLVEVMRGA